MVFQDCFKLFLKQHFHIYSYVNGALAKGNGHPSCSAHLSVAGSYKLDCCHPLEDLLLFSRSILLLIKKICSFLKMHFFLFLVASELIMVFKKFSIPPYLLAFCIQRTGIYWYIPNLAPLWYLRTLVMIDKSSVVSHKPILTAVFFLPCQFSFVYIYFMCPLTSTVKLCMDVILTPGGSGRSLRAGKAINQQLLWLWKTQQ